MDELDRLLGWVGSGEEETSTTPKQETKPRVRRVAQLSAKPIFFMHMDEGVRGFDEAWTASWKAFDAWYF